MRRRLLGCALGGAAMVLAVMPAVAGAAEGGNEPATDPPGERVYLVTMSDPGTAGHSESGSETDYRTSLRNDQDDTLERVGAPEPLYRWTTALSGFAVELDTTQAATVAALPEVELVEAEDTLTLAGAPVSSASAAAGASQPAAPAQEGAGGRGTVIGFVDSGIHPDNPVFASNRSLGPRPKRFEGGCAPAEGWSRKDCNDKVIGARFFIRGFGVDHLRSEARVSPRDDDGHGTQVASIAAGDSEVTALVDGKDRGEFSGVAPDARIAAYKACWSAPDPDDDGCSTADVVSAIDAAVRDRVDVLNLSMNGLPGLDTVDLALLGAAERDIAVTMAAGNGSDLFTSAQPWTTVVGASTGRDLRGELRLSEGSTFEGMMAAQGLLRDDVSLVSGAQIPAPGEPRADARLCLPGSLDAARANGKMVLCERGRIARVDKSAAVELADGVGMILVNAARKALSADFHAVPTLHISAHEGQRLRRELRTSGDHEVTGRLARIRSQSDHPQVLPWSARGRPDSDVVEPALVSPGIGVLAASTPSGDSSSWELLTGTSASTATVSGLTARLLSRHPDWSAPRIRSALMTSSTSAGEVTSLAQGAGVPSAERAERPGLVFDLAAGDYRRTLEGDADPGALNLPSVLTQQPDSSVVVQRAVTNTGNRHMYYSSMARGFSGHRVSVTPAALRIAPGETRKFQIRITPRGGTRPDVDSGWVAWRGANGVRVRIPVVLAK